MADEWRIGQFKVKPLLERKPGMATYTDHMVAQLKALNIQKKPASTVQCASTQATLDRDSAKDAEHWNRPLPKEVVEANKLLVESYRAGDISTLDKLVEARKISPEEYALVDGARKKPKNSIGQSSLKGASDQALEKAVNSFLFSPPADLTTEERKRIAEMVPYAPPPQPVEARPEIDRGPAGRIAHLLWKMGAPSYWFTKKELSIDVANNLPTHAKKQSPS